MDTCKPIYQSYAQTLEELSRTGMLRRLPEIDHDGAWVISEGRRMLNLSGNDYLGIATRGDLNAGVPQLTAEHGLSGSSSSRLLTGGGHVYRELEDTIARSYHRASALIFGSGYHMNVGIISALADAETLIVADRLVHASMIDGIRLSGARFERFRHNDLEHLERIIERATASYSRILVLVESIYSMDGDRADLRGLVALKARYPSVMLYVDEAHAVGAIGPHGLGLAEETDTIRDIDIIVGTMGKALASMGGYLVADRVLREYLVNKCRPLIFSTALPPIVVATSLYIWTRLEDYSEARATLSARSLRLRETLATWGIATPSTSHIIPIVIGTASDTIRVSEELQALGYYVLPIRPPTVPDGQCRIRLSLTADTDIEGLIVALRSVLRPEQ